MSSDELVPIVDDLQAVSSASSGSVEQAENSSEFPDEKSRSRRVSRPRTGKAASRPKSQGNKKNAPHKNNSADEPSTGALSAPEQAEEIFQNASSSEDFTPPEVSPEQSEAENGDTAKGFYPAFDLHQDAELWPEAWPDEEPVAVKKMEEVQAEAPADAAGAAVDAPDTAESDIAPAVYAEPPVPFAEDKIRQPKDALYSDAYAAAIFGEASADPLLGAGDNPAESDESSVSGPLPSASDQKQDDSSVEPDDTAISASRRKGGKAGAVAKAAPQARGKKRKMFISVLPGEQVEVAITEENQVQEYYVQMLHQLKTKGNIYKGVIHNVDASLQAAFVSYGAHKNGFLQIDEVHPDYYLAPHDPGKGKKYPLIQKVLKPGQEVLVQVVKEPTGGKGAFLSTYLSIPGRFLVLTPGRTQFGVSRKVEDDSDRERLRALLDTLPTQDGLGVIMRTASLSASKTSMLKDLQVLKRQWKEVRTRGTTEAAPCLVYEEPSLAGRAVRDYLSDDIKEIWVDDPETAQEIKDTVSLIFPRRGSANLVRLHEDNQRTMWEAFDLKRQIEQIYQREVNLPSGGRLVFDQTEALMAIDINSGKIAGRNNFESMALRTNIEAAQVIARQLRLRDIGGQIVIDFIEMRERSHWRELEKVMRNAMKNDRARYDVAKVSAFGLMEVVRQRLGSSSISVTMEPCPCCNGTGMRRNMEWQALSALRDIRHLALHKSENEKQIRYESDPEVALYLLNNKRSALTALEERYDVDVEIKYR